MRIRHLIILFSVFSFSLLAQTAGNPIKSVSKNEWTMGLSGNYLNQQMGTTTAVAKRILVKSMWGVRDWLGIYGLVGTVQLAMDAGKPGVRNFKDRYRFGYGAGAHWQFDLNPVMENGIGLFGDIQVLKFVSQGSFFKSIPFIGGSMTDEFAMKYDWGEITGCVGIVLPIRNMRFYGGGVGWTVRREDAKKQYRIEENTQSKQYIGQVKGEYQSGVWSGGVLGFEYVFPQRYSISIEGIVFNEQNYQIMVGISQTGSPAW